MAQAAPLKEKLYKLREYSLMDNDGNYERSERKDVTSLVEAVIALSYQWRADRQVFSVEVIQAVGRVITETEKIFEFEL